MKHSLALLAVIILTPSFNVHAEEAAEKALDQIRRHIPPLAHPHDDRLPILVWQSSGFPTGLESGRVAEIQQALLERGIMPLCNPCANPERAESYLPVFQYWQQQKWPVCILAQGWLQTLCTADKNKRSRCRHQPPADQSVEYPCPVAMFDARRIAAHAESVAATLHLLKERGVGVDLLLVDFESGLYLRNTADREDRVAAQAAVARQCAKCVEQFGAKALEGPVGFASMADRVRAELTRKALCDPARQIFPELALGNFYAWPINRLPRPEGRWPAYGFEHSGMNVLMPSMYMNAGWRGAGRDQARMNWTAFYCCLERFSPPASVRRDGELLIPWPHVWLGGTYLYLTMKGRALPEPWVMAEMARHMMLRGAETFAIWVDAMSGDYPAGYPYPQYAAMGQLVYDLLGVQEGYGDMLRFHRFLRRARPMTFDVPGAPNELGVETATWSGMQTAEKALVRTVCFAGEKVFQKEIFVFGRKVSLRFGPRGRTYWIYADGRAEEVAATGGCHSP